MTAFIWIILSSEEIFKKFAFVFKSTKLHWAIEQITKKKFKNYQFRGGKNMKEILICPLMCNLKKRKNKEGQK